MKDQVLLLLDLSLGKLIPRTAWPNKEKLLQLYEQAQERLHAELNIVNLIDSLRQFNELMQSSLLTEDLREDIQNAKQVIELDAPHDTESKAERPSS